jgi:hypothetical protein
MTHLLSIVAYLRQKMCVCPVIFGNLLRCAETKRSLKKVSFYVLCYQSANSNSNSNSNSLYNDIILSFFDIIIAKYIFRRISIKEEWFSWAKPYVLD